MFTNKKGFIIIDSILAITVVSILVSICYFITYLYFSHQNIIKQNIERYEQAYKMRLLEIDKIIK